MKIFKSHHILASPDGLTGRATGKRFATQEDHDDYSRRSRPICPDDEENVISFATTTPTNEYDREEAEAEMEMLRKNEMTWNRLIVFVVLLVIPIWWFAIRWFTL